MAKIYDVVIVGSGAGGVYPPEGGTGSQGGSGGEALGLLRTRRFELIISDWHMEPVSGYELLQEARRDPR